ncbi:hypothetical protein GKE60_28095 [Escherichia coli]|nr:hypothetical protein [Escherichia coli]
MFFFIVSINGLLLLHFCKWRNGHVAVYSSLFFSSSPLTDCYFYTSANGDFEISISGRMRAPFAPGYPYFDIRLYRNSVIALSG